MTIRQKAVFLDRDGVLIHDVHYLSKLDDITLYPDVPHGLSRLKAAGYLLIVVTNQSGVARGYFPDSFVRECHDEINRILAPHHVQLDHLYYCPHHINGKPPLDIQCECRKPAPGLIYQAHGELDLDLDQATMIGDKLCDVELAANAQIRGILLTTGHGRDAVEQVAESFPDTPVFSSFNDAVDFILTSPDANHAD